MHVRHPVRLLLVNCGDPEPDIASRHGAYTDWFRAAIGPAADLVVRDPRHERCDERWLAGVAGAVISGSPHSVYDPLPWVPALSALLVEAVERRALPVLGVCFGHQLLAQTFHGRVQRNPRGREVGSIEVELAHAAQASPLLGPFAPRFHALATHCDTVVEAPPGATVLARSALDECQAFSYGSAYGVQFHPEVSADVIRAVLRTRADLIRAEGLDPSALADGVREAPIGAALLRRFAGLAQGALASRRVARRRALARTPA